MRPVRKLPRHFSGSSDAPPAAPALPVAAAEEAAAEEEAVAGAAVNVPSSCVSALHVPRYTSPERQRCTPNPCLFHALNAPSYTSPFGLTIVPDPFPLRSTLYTDDATASAAATAAASAASASVVATASASAV
jgi:hypothetical protein